MLKTSRNEFGFARGWIADRWPDLIKSSEGGSNQVLFRGSWVVTEERQLLLARLPERRRMMWLRLRNDEGVRLCVANLHATAGKQPRAVLEIERAAAAARAWSGGDPLILGGDFNVRSKRHPELFERLAQDGFSGPTAPMAIDHLLARGATVAEAPRQLPDARREVETHGTARVRLSDHAVVVAAFNVR